LVKQIRVSHSSFACDLFCALSRGLVYISNANPACSCVYICKFQFRPIHPPLGDYHPHPRRRSRGEDKYKEPEARSADGGGDPVGDGDFSSRLHIGTGARGHQPSGRSPLKSSRTSGAPIPARRCHTSAKAGPPQNTNAALAACGVLGGPPVHTARQSPSGRRGHLGAKPTSSTR
jgi:hypothetical protein